MLSLLAGAGALALTTSPALDPPVSPPPPFHCGACSFNSGEAFIHTLPGESMPAGKWAFALRADYQDFDAFSASQLLSYANQGVFTHSIDSSFVLRAGAAHALSDELTVGADLPWISNQNMREGVDNGGTPAVQDNGDQRGLGDMSLFAQWKFHEDLDSRVYASLYFGAKVPTGKTDVHSPTGELLEPDHQPGSGSTDPFAGVALSKSFGTSTLAASVFYTLAGDGSQNSNLGDVLRLSLGWGWSGSQATGAPVLRWMVELNGQWHDHMTMDGVTDPNSGGVQLFVAPGVRASWSSGFSCFFSVGVPLVQNLDGTQSETNYRASTGIGFSL
jgi:hypothetical protein